MRNRGKITIGSKAPGFSLEDTRNTLVSLHDFQGRQQVYLVLNRGFS